MIGAHDTRGDRRVGRYVLGEQIGKGGMAEVFIGHAIGARGFRKPVAIKRLLSTRAGDLDSIERLIDEAKLLVGMQHGNIVSVLDLVCEGDDVFVVMEYVDGPSVRQLLKLRGEELPIAISTYVVHAAAIGLEYAHARPGGAVIHADISPSNVLLTRTGEVRVADFGIARREGVGAGSIEGKWAYMAPEQARGELLSPRADVFALGVVLYELASGTRPRSTVAGYEHCLSAAEVTPLHVLAPSAPAALSQLCARCLADEPAARPSMRELRDTLLDLRYAEGWRDGAGELAELIREAAVPSPRMPHSVATALISIRPSQVAVTSEPKMFATGTVHGRQSESVLAPLASRVTAPTMAIAIADAEPSISDALRSDALRSDALRSDALRSLEQSRIAPPPIPAMPSRSRSIPPVASAIPEASLSFALRSLEESRSLAPPPVPSRRSSIAPADASGLAGASLSFALQSLESRSSIVASSESMPSLAALPTSSATAMPAFRSSSGMLPASPSPALPGFASSSPVSSISDALPEPRRAMGHRSRLVWIFAAGMIAGVAAAWIAYDDDRLTVAPQPIAQVRVRTPGTSSIDPMLVVEPIELAEPRARVVETIPATEHAYREPAAAPVPRKPMSRVPRKTVELAAVPVAASPVGEVPVAAVAAPESAPTPPAVVIEAPRSRTTAALVVTGTDLFLAGKLDEAREAFEGALAIDPGNALAHRGLGFVFQRTGANAKAIVSLRAYLTLRPTAHDTAAIEARIARLGGS